MTRRSDNIDNDADDASSVSTQSSATDEHLRLLREALERIKKSSGTDTDDDNTNKDDDEDVDDFADWCAPYWLII